MIAFTVFGVPVPKGSKRAFVLPNSRRVAMVESSAKTLKPWLSDVRYQASLKMNGHDLLLGPVALHLDFSMPKPKSYPKRRQLFMTKARGDADKIARAVLDALKGVLYRDDAQVVELLIRKEYGDRPGVRIQAWAPETPMPFEWSIKR